MSFFKVEQIEVEANKKQATTTIVTIDRPPMNALSSEVLDELQDLIDNLKNTSAVIFTGEGKAFIAGADIAEMKNFSTKEAQAFSKKGQEVFEKWEKASFVSIAAINGYALGGGLEFALSCNIRIASEKAMLGLPEVTLGLIPGFGGTQRLARLASTGTAAYFALTGGMFSAQEAYDLGILQKITDAENLLEEAKKIAAMVELAGPNAVQQAKSLLYKNFYHHADKDFAAEVEAFGKLFEHDEPKEGLTAFLEKRPPKFR